MAVVDPKLQIKWSLICSVPQDENMEELREFGKWFTKELAVAGRGVGVFYDFDEKPTFTERVQPGDLDNCILAYEKLHKEYPFVHVVIHILPGPASDEYSWMKSLSSQFGLIRQGILLENAKARFANPDGSGVNKDVFKNVAQWIGRSAHRLCSSKNPNERQYDLRIGTGEPIINRQYVPHVMQTAVNNVLHGLNLAICRDESAVQVDGLPNRLNEYGVAQLFRELTVTGVTLKGSSATVVFANKYQAYQACDLNNKIVDSRHTLRVTPLSEEVLAQLSDPTVV